MRARRRSCGGVGKGDLGLPQKAKWSVQRLSISSSCYTTGWNPSTGLRLGAEASPDLPAAKTRVLWLVLKAKGRTFEARFCARCGIGIQGIVRCTRREMILLMLSQSRERRDWTMYVVLIGTTMLVRRRDGERRAS